MNFLGKVGSFHLGLWVCRSVQRKPVLTLLVLPFADLITCLHKGTDFPEAEFR